MSSGGFDPAAFKATLERLAANKDHGSASAQPAFDPILRRNLAADAIGDRRIDDFRQALEGAGFAYTPAERLRPYPDGSRHKLGEWRNTQMRRAFTSEDLLTMFASPQEFWEWVVLMRRRAKIARLQHRR